MGAVDSEEEKAGGLFHSSSIACNCAKFGGARLVDTLFRDVRARVLDCLK